jgi:TetR/AcrR family transcriptional regulator
MSDVPISDRNQSKSASDKTSKRRIASPPGGRSSQRREQQRSVETRIAILNAALSEFAEKGYETASTRGIARRADVHNALLAYHFHNKEELWKATAEHFFGEIAGRLGKTAALDKTQRPINRLREEFRSFFNFIIEQPTFHQFMERETQPGSPRMPWLMETFLAPIMDRTFPLIEAAQKDNDLPKGHPVLLYYFLVSITTVLLSMRAELEYHSGVDPLNSATANKYWKLIDQLVFAAPSGGSNR